jgi:amino acid adenylation domain-containing protein
MDKDLRDGMRSLLEQELMAKATVRRPAARSVAPVADTAAPAASPAPAPAADRRLEADVTRLALASLGVPAERFDPRANLASYGADSIAITELMAQVSRFLGVSIAPTTFFEAKNLDELCAILRKRFAAAVERHYGKAPPQPAAQAPTTAPVAAPVAAVAPTLAAPPVSTAGTPADIDAWLARHGVRRGTPRASAPTPAATQIHEAAAPVAIIAMDGRFAGSPDLEALREHLRQGDDCMEEIPADRWDWRAIWGDPKQGDFCDVKHGGFVAGHDIFDAGFFSISPKEAELMDPQHRLFMECVWHLLDNAGYAPTSLAGRKVGIFLGINLLDYVDLANRQAAMEALQMTGLGHAFCPNRISFLLDVHGPSEVIDTACSSSLVAIHRAVMSIRHEGCEMAIAGGANLMLTPKQHMMFAKVGMLSRDGRCKAFGAGANGYARADGVGAVLLKRLDLAERDGDNILAVIRGSAEHHGGTASSLTAPNARAQARLIVEAHRQADTDPRSVTMIECHGTGTPLGDPIEIDGLKQAFATLYQAQGLPAPARPHCLIGSVKSNIGHAETAAGVAGLVKVVLALQDGIRYRSLHCTEPNPLVDLAGTPFALLAEASPWERPLVDGRPMPRRAGISSFGAGGTIVHLVVEEYQAPAGVQPELRHAAVIPLSARNETALRAAAEALLAWLEHSGPLDAIAFARLAYTLQTGRDAMRCRLALPAADARELAESLSAWLRGAAGPAVQGAVPRGDAPAAIDAPNGLPAAELAVRWAAGAAVDWAKLWPGRTPRRLALPGYPFQRKRYWLPDAPNMPSAPVPRATAAAISPALKPTAGADGIYRLQLTGQEFFLADHRVQGIPVLPGVAYLELVWQAAAARGLRDFCIRRTIWQKPLQVRSPVTVEVSFKDEADGWPRVEIASTGASGERQLHAQARLGPREATEPPAAKPAERLAAHPRAVTAEEVYRRFAAIGIDYGPGHRALQALHLGRDAEDRPTVLAELRLPAAQASEAREGLDAFVLHPGLLDGALQATLGIALAADAGQGTALPFALERVEMLGPCCERMWVQVRQRSAGTLDIDLLDETGAVRVALRGFGTRPLGGTETAASAETLIFFAGWEDVPTAVPPAPTFARRLVRLAGGDAERCTALALPGVEPALLAPVAADPADGYAAAAAALLRDVQALVTEAGRPAGPVLLQVLVASAEAGAWSGLAGLLKTARLEYPWLWGQLVCVHDPADAAAALEAAARYPVAELAWQDGHLRQPAWHERTGLAPRPARPWREDGVYLVTGGAGGIGRLLARDILDHAPGATVVLAGRSPLAGERATWLTGLQGEGRRIEYRQADMADGSAVQALVQGIRGEHGRLDGVFHCAGLIDDQPLARKDAATLTCVLAPKVAGVCHLDRALADGPLDFLVLFSSLSGVFGNPGQADYAAANAFLDRYAEDREARRARGLCQGRTLAVAWPLWREGGMALSAEAVRLMRQTTGLDELATDAGLDALAHALAGDACGALVMAGDAARLRRRVAELNRPPAAVAPAAPAAASAAGSLRGPVLAALTDCVCALLKVERDDLDAEVELTEYGFDSIGFTQFANAINERFGLEITPTLFFEHPTLASLTDCLAGAHGNEMAAALGIAEQPAPPVVEAAPVAAWGDVPAEAPAAPPPPPVTYAAATAEEGIAIVALSGRFPMAEDPEQLWANLEAGRDCIGEVPADRWNGHDWRQSWGDAATEANRTQIKWGGFIDGLADFDPMFFNISPREAADMDPQQRLLLMETWRLLERAGMAPRSLSGSRTGVFVGIADTGYGRLVSAAGRGIEGFSMTGLAPSLGPNRISYFFNLTGPSVAVETACSSALVAIHRAVEALRSGTCDAAIAGGVNSLLLPDAFVGFSKAGMLAPDGRCKPFSAAANGYARGEGLGLVLLKPLAAAERDCDTILGVIRASMENHGGHASSLTAPNPRAQADLIRRAWRRAGIDPRTAGYIEAHGTGTPLGDPIEVEALVAAFADLEREAAGTHGELPAMPCGIGSVKGNLGHLEIAAGAAGLAKVLLQMAHGRLVRTLHCETLNPYLKFAGSRFQVVQENRPWPRPRDRDGRELPRRAGVSSFGFGGSNAHLVVEEYLPPAAPLPVQSGPAMIVLSARTPEQLAAAARRLAEGIAPDMPLARIAWTLQVGRDAMEHRLAFLAADHGQLRERLLACAEGRLDEAAGIHAGRIKGNKDTLSILDGDEEMRCAVASLPARGKHDSLLQLWVRGLAVDWRALFPQNAHLPRLVLPSYPFSVQRCWPETGPMLPSVPMPPAVPPAVAMTAPAPEIRRAASADFSLPAPAVKVAAPTPIAEAPEARVERALAALTRIAAQVLDVDPSVLESDTELGEYGFDSITMTGFASKTNEALGLSLTPADFFEFATLGRLAAHIAGESAFAAGTSAPKPLAAPVPVPVPIMAPPVPMEADEGDDPIAIVGISCRFPMAADAEAFWQNLVEGRDCIGEIPADRWDWREVYGDPKREPTKTNIRWAGFIDGVFEFDPLFFGISPREAKLMDPQQRLLMMHVWKALEDAGHAPRSFAGRAVGLFVATSSSGYRETIGADTGGEGYVATGAVPSVGPNRTSYFLDWHGPSEPVETACSSSLVALHRAVQAMRAGDCEMAVVGGVNTIVTPEAHINFAKAGMLSPDGRCKTFSAQANGYVRGEGIGMIVLRRLSAARRDGDSIYALVRGSAVNHGGRANSLTAPNTLAQAEVIKEAWRRAGVDHASIGYIEAHGTGTPLGDPVEVNALKLAYRELGAQPGAAPTCGIGSVKTNIGHLELAAGIAGLVKVLLQMRHGMLVRSLHGEERNPYVDLGGSPFYLVNENRPWAAAAADGKPLPLRAGISSFGFGGVNAHVVLEAYSQTTAAPATGEPVCVVLSARDEARLREQAAQLLQALEAGRYDAADLPDLAWTLQVGREAMKHRLAVVVSSLDRLAAELRAWLAGDAGAVRTGIAAAGVPAAVGNLTEVASLWVGGAEVDWARLASDLLSQRRRLHLPSYPFARESYRIGAWTAAGAKAAAAIPPAAQAAGLACALRLNPAGEAVCTLDGNAFYLRDHVVQGARVLPGAMSVELVRLAHALKQGAGRETRASLAQVVWLQPLTAGAVPVEAAIAFAPEPGGNGVRESFQLRVGATVHAKGLVGPGPTTDAPVLDLADLERHCPRSLTPDALYARYAALGLAYGPAFRTVADLRAGEGEFLARLALPVAAGNESGFGIHPVLLDGAFQACLALFAEDQGEAALPFVLESLHYLAPTPAELRVHGRLAPSDGGAVRRIDIDLADATGRVCVQVRGFSVRLLPGRGKSVPADATATGAPAARAALQRYLADLVAEEASLAPTAIDPAAALEAYGIDSIMITRLTDRLEGHFGPLPRTLFFDHQTLDALAGYFAAHHAGAVARLPGMAGTPSAANVSPTQPEPAAPAAASTASTATAGDIAIIGLAGRYPGADDLRAFWDNLAAGRDCIAEVPANRWDHAAWYDPVRGTPGKTNSKWGGFIDGHDCFDPRFFNIAPREAGYQDPQERLFLQCAWETLEDAGYTRDALAEAGGPPAETAAQLGGGNVGVFVGVMYEEYQLYGAESTLRGEPLALSGSAASIANRVSYFCNFHGPSLAVDSMCSSSLSAIHLACESLRGGGCDLALAGGVNLTLHPNKYLALAQGRFTSSTGRCESFGEGGDGYVPGEGVGAVLLKPQARAEADGDRIYAVIRGSALNHGGKTNGYAVPNPHAQEAVIRRALARAGVDPAQVDYVEAHGTGTRLGDPIEIAALTRAFAGRDRSAPCAIGSVKSNIGHTESAAGIAGLTKVLLQLRHGQLAPSLHSETLNPHIDFAGTPFVVQRSLAPWPPARDPTSGRVRPRIAGVSSFGAGGANAHLIVEEYLPPAAVAAPGFDAGRPGVFPVSARAPEQLQAMLERLAQAVQALDDTALPAVAAGLQFGREAFEHRAVAVAADRRELLAQLAALQADPAALPAPVADRRIAELTARWLSGAAVDWHALWAGRSLPRKIGLPTYPFARQRYWVPGHALGAPAAPAIPAMPARVEGGSALRIAAENQAAPPLLFAPEWRAAPLSAAVPAPERVLAVLCEPERYVAEKSRRWQDGEWRVLAGGDATIDARFTAYARELLALIQNLVRERPASALLQVVVPLAGEAALLEGLAGLLRTAQLEHASLRCQLVALADPVADLADLLRRERTGGDAQVCYVAGRRQVRAWRELPWPATLPAIPWRDGGVYLISGGAGGVGLLLAREIARRVRNPVLCLVGRSAPDEALRARLADLPGVLYRQADLSRAGEADRLVAELLAAHGRIDGIVHAAGINRDKGLMRKSADELAEVLAPKVAGLHFLDRATAACELDFVLLFASVSGALGNPGQADYACANAWLDAFAAHRNALAAQGQRHGATLSIDWPYWRDGGMRMADAQVAAMVATTGVLPLATAQAWRALDAAWQHRADAQVLVFDGDAADIRRLVLGSPAAAPTPPAPAVPDSADLQMQATAWVTECLADILAMAPGDIRADQAVDRYGVDSVLAAQLIERLQRDLGPLPQTLLFEYPTMAALAAALLASHGPALAARFAQNDIAPTEAVPAPAEGVAPTASAAPTAPAAAGDIAVIAVAGRYPEADSVEAFWDVLREGRDCVGEIPAERWDADERYSPRKGQPGTSYCKWGGFLTDVDCFDPGFFGLSPRDAILMDPQERLFLQTVWHLMERGGHTRALLRQRYGARVGVYVGAMYQPYHGVETDEESRILVNLSSHASMANRVSWFFDLQGPSVAVDTLCSSGLQAVHLAVQSLRRGECALAIAGGVNLSLTAGKYVGLSRAGMLGSGPDSRSFTEGDGYLPAEGVGAVLLKPLADALRDGDPVIAVVKASAVNHGGHSAGYGVPSAEAQARLIAGNFRQAGIDPASIGYVEAAANGSALGDAIEFRALTRAFREFTPEQGFCALGSVKANMGHAESASGMAQLTKVLLQLQHRQLVPGVIGPLSSHLQVEGSPFRLQRELADWPAIQQGAGGLPRRATVSSFGAGGSNVHLILEEAPAPAQALADSADARGPWRFVFSARNVARLGEWLALLREHLLRHPGLSMARLAATLAFRREPMECACAIVAADQTELIERLAAVDPDRLPDDPAVSVTPADPALAPLVLPGYAFARERYWLPVPPVAAAPAAAATPVASAAAPVADGVPGLILDQLAAELALPRAALSADTSFRALGADSMVVLRLIYRIAAATGVELAPGDLERHPTPAALAACVAERQAAVPAKSRRSQDGESATESAAPTDFPLSAGQQGLWRWQQLHPDSSAYNLPLAFRADGADMDRLAAACRAMTAAWPLLACRIATVDGADRWQAAAAQPELDVHELPAGSGLEAAARERARRPFDLRAEAPVRFELLREAGAGNAALLLVLVHHIVFDGLSAVHFSRYLWETYGRLAAGAPLPSAPAGASFADFVAWEADYLQSPAAEADLAYWQAQLADEPPPPCLPADRHPAAGQELVGDSLERRVPADLWAAGRDCARRLGIDTSAFFLGALQILLYRLGGQEDLVVGMPVLGRPQRRFGESLGYFVNLLPMRATVQGGATAGEFLRAAQARLTAGLDHGAMPYALLAERSLTRQPVAVVYSWQSFLTPQDLSGLAGIPVRHLPALRQEGDVPLALELYAAGDELRLVAAFDRARFDAATVEGLADRYLALVAAICAAPESPIGRLDWLAAAERRRIVEEWSGRAIPPVADDEGIELRIARQAAATPEAEALVVGQQRLSYSELQVRAERLAACILGWGVQPGQPVAVLLERGAESIVALLAVLRAGAVWVPLDPDTPDRRLALILEDAAPAMVIAETATRARLPAGEMPVLLADRPLSVGVADVAAPELDPEAPAYLIYTSGSTGRPKGVAVSRRALAVHCRAVTEHYGLTADDRVLQFASHHVDAALEQILPTLAVGACLVMRENELWTPATLAKRLTWEGISVADLPPAYLREVLQAWSREAVTVSCPRLLIVGGEVLTPELVRLWQASPLAGARFLNAYGPTEATVTATVHEVCAADAHGGALPIGRPLAGGWVAILDRDGNPLPEGLVGELAIGGPRLANGYWNRPDLTAERFAAAAGLPGERLYRSGDLASFIPGGAGAIAFHGRCDHQVKIRGFRIELEEIEAVLRVAGAGEVAVIALPQAGGDPGLVACVAAPEDARPDEAELRRAVAERLPAAMCPAAYVFLDRLPVTAGGKLDRQALLKLTGGAETARPRRSASADFSPEADETTARLAAIWCELLGLDAVAEVDDFFLCGGHSLLVLRLLGAIRSAFGRELSMAALHAAPTLGQQARLLRGETPASSMAPPVAAPVPLNGGGKAPALFCPHPVGGGVGCYRALASCFEGRRPVFGLPSPALEQGRVVPESLPEMAAAMVTAMRGVQPAGPYHLAGWSMGGLLAYEMARQLRHAGEPVALLALLDSYTPEELARLEALQKVGAGDTVEQERAAFAHDLGELAAAGVATDPDQEALLFDLFQANLRALRAYAPGPYDGVVHLLCCTDPQGESPAARRRVWESLAAGGVTLAELPGDHYSILRMPSLVQVAERLAAWLGDGGVFAK